MENVTGGLQGDSDLYEALIAVVDAGSISEAARHLGLPRPTLSRRLGRLEELLGLELVRRTTRHVRPTEVGERLVGSVRPLLLAMAEAEREALDQGHEVRGPVTLSVAPLLAPALRPVCARLHREHPALHLRVEASLRLVDLDREPVDLVLRVGALRDSSWGHRRIAVVRVGAYASEGYLASAPRLRAIADLTAHRLLLGTDPDGRPRGRWPTPSGDGVPVSGRFVTDDRALLRDMVLADAGIALLTEPTAKPGVAAGRLRQVLPRAVGTSLQLHLLYGPHRLLPARVRLVIDALTELFEADDWLAPP